MKPITETKQLIESNFDIKLKSKYISELKLIYNERMNIIRARAYLSESIKHFKERVIYKTNNLNLMINCSNIPIYTKKKL